MPISCVAGLAVEYAVATRYDEAEQTWQAYFEHPELADTHPAEIAMCVRSRRRMLLDAGRFDDVRRVSRDANVRSGRA